MAKKAPTREQTRVTVKPQASRAAPPKPARAPATVAERKPAAVAPERRSPPVPERRPPPAAAPAAPRNTLRAPVDLKHPAFESGEASSEEHRKFPRARVNVPFSLWIEEEGGGRRFSATLTSWNLSVSGAFLESTFFLPVGTRLRASFRLDESEPAIEASAEIIRQEQPHPRTGEGRSGMAIRFVEFFGQTEVTLAKLFLGEQLRSFAQMYMESARAKSLRNEFDRVVDALAAWELQKVTTAIDIWQK